MSHKEDDQRLDNDAEMSRDDYMTRKFIFSH